MCGKVLVAQLCPTLCDPMDYNHHVTLHKIRSCLSFLVSWIFIINRCCIILNVSSALFMMPKSWPLCTSAEPILGDRVLSEVKGNSFITLHSKGGHSGFLPPKTICPNPPEEFNEEFYSNSSRLSLLIRLGFINTERWTPQVSRCQISCLIYYWRSVEK